MIKTKTEKLERLAKVAQSDIELEIWHEIYTLTKKLQGQISSKLEAKEEDTLEALTEGDKSTGELISYANRKMCDIFDEYTIHWRGVEQSDFGTFLEKYEEIKEEE